MRSSTQLIPVFWVRPSFFRFGLGLVTPFLSRSRSQLRSKFFGLKFNALDIGGGGGAFLIPSLRCPVQGPCLSVSLPTESTGQWTAPYTKRQDLNSSRNVRLRFSVSVLIINKHQSPVARPYLGWLSDWRGPRHRGLQPSSVSNTVVRSGGEGRGPQSIITLP